MNWKLAGSVVLFGLASLAAPGCAANADPADDGDAEEAAASEDELNAAQRDLVGAWHGSGASARPPTFQGIVFNADGSFFADVDTGIRCFRAPCPSNVRLSGRFTATKHYVRLTAAPGAEASDFYGRYKYAHAGDEITLTRTGTLWSGWSNELTKELSYCAQPSDCDSQALIHPMCVGGWTCGSATSSNTCAYKCGIVPVGNAIWPADAQTLVAKNAGGGFTPPPPPGSECGVGAATYTLDVATKKVSYDTCKLVDWSTPLTKETGSKTLSDAEMAQVTAAMNALSFPKDKVCGADKPFLTVTVTSPSQGTKKYTDSFYSCMGTGPFVDNIDGVLAAFRQVTGH